MPTGACGINCDVCQLNLLGHCSSCGPGKSNQAARKSAAQQRILGHPCAILECARLNHIDYCPRDCPSFPCDNFTRSRYPYGRSFLEMQQRRRSQGPPSVDPSGRPIEIDPAWWDVLAKRELTQVANFTLTEIDAPSGCLQFEFLDRQIRVDPRARVLMQKTDQGWEKLERPMLELVILDYFSRIEYLHPMGREMVGPEDLADAHYFTGRSRLPTDSLVARYGGDPGSFAAAGRRLNGHPESMADVAFRLMPFPRVPVYCLLWLASDEFGPRISILFDRSIEKVLAPPAIWCLVRLCAYRLLRV